MFGYIDESGHTGSNLFDPAQPTFYNGAFTTKTNFDVLSEKRLNVIARSVGFDSLHANELGAERIAKIAGPIWQLLSKVDFHFIVSKTPKTDFAVIKFFDTIFDSGENLAVPWISYNSRALRNMLLLRVAMILDENLLKKFWDGLLDTNRSRSTAAVSQVLSALLERLDELPDERTREVVGRAFRWVIENPEVLDYHVATKAHRRGHMPNMATFPDLLRGLDAKAKKWKRKVVEIKIDRQSQFDSALQEWHKLHTNAAPGHVNFPGESEKFPIRVVAGSRMTKSSSTDSGGIQMVDLFLWLLRQRDSHRPMPDECIALFTLMSQRSVLYELSLTHIADWTETTLHKIWAADLTPEHEATGKALRDFGEERAKQLMADYRASKAAIPQKLPD